MFLFCLVFAMFCARLFICALWSPAGKGLTSCLVTTNGDPEGRMFLYPHTNNGFFFWNTIKYRFMF